MKNEQVKLNPYIKFYTLSKLSHFGNEIFHFFKAQQGGILNSCRNHPLIRHGNRFTEEWLSKFF